MKMEPFELCPRRRSILLCVPALLALLASPMGAQAADAYYINNGSVITAPQIDASNFVNYGTFNIFTTYPFETSDTLTFTNYGSLVGAAGWRFDYASPGNGGRQLADTFFNANTATVQANDAPAVIVLGLPTVSPVNPSYLWVHATNIVNQGLLSVGANGWLLLAGTNVGVARSGLEVQALTPAGSRNIGTNFIPDTGISDLVWAQTNLNFPSGRIWDGLTAATAGGVLSFTIPGPNTTDSLSNSFGIFVTVTNIVGITNPGAMLPTVDPTNILITNIYVPTNIYKQAVFVGISDPTTLTVGVRYFPSTSITNPFTTVAVDITFTSTNAVTTLPEPTSLFFYDTLASETNRGINQNVQNTLAFRPANYVLSRLDDGRYRAGSSGNGVPDSLYLFDRNTFSNNVVSGEYAAYWAFVDDLVSEPPPVTGGTVTNLPGRVQIYAQNLDMRSARVRGAGEVIVKTEHLIGSSGAVVDCQNLSYNLASTNGLLSVQNLTKTAFARLKGDLLAWSALWSNSMTMIYSNNYSISNIVDTNGMTIGMSATQSPLTNGAALNLHTLLLDALFQTSLPVITWDMLTRGTNVVIDDNMTVVQSFLVDGQSLTLNGNITFSQATIDTSFGTVASSSISDWVYTNAPNLLYFTNNGTLTLPGNGHFGDDGPVPYIAFVNLGSINAASISLDGGYFQNSGNLAAGGPLNMYGGTGKLENGQSTAGGAVQLACNNLKLNNYQLSAGSLLRLNVAGSLLDAGGVSSNLLSLHGGLNMLAKPLAGDLLGTTFQLLPPNFVAVDHVWAGLDRGVTANGYSNNVALGKLLLSPQTTDAARVPLFVFSGAGAQNGLYVDLLDFSNLGTNWNLIQQQIVQIDPNLVVYYAAAKLGFTPPTNPAGIPMEPEEFLDGQFGGHLRWVSSFAGPNSSVDVVSNGVTIVVNKALRFSKIIDSNGNGIPNFYDPNPFNTVPPVLSASILSAGQPAGRSIAISWNALPNTLYHVEFSTSLPGANWQPLSDYLSDSQTTQRATIWDTNAPVDVQRFYRVRYTK